MDMLTRCHDEILPGDDVVSVRPADWSDGAARGRVARRWPAEPDAFLVEWDDAPPSEIHAIVARRELRHEGRCPDALAPGDRVRVRRSGAPLPVGTTGRIAAITAEGWIAVVPDGTVDTVVRVRRVDLTGR